MAKCPWYISAHAVKRYLHVVGRRVVDDGPAFDKAEEELIELAIDTMKSNRVPKQLRAQHLLQYRSGRPLQLMLIVSTEVREEGKLPQLVDVRGSHAGHPRR